MIHLAIKGTNKVALIDDEFAHLQQFIWRLSAKGYVIRYGSRTYRLHQEVAGPGPEGTVVDHINRNRLDCRKSNLRHIPLKFSQQNVGSRSNSSSRFRGVYFDKERMKWVAQATVDGKQIRLGRFDSEEVAAALAKSYREKYMPFSVD